MASPALAIISVALRSLIAAPLPVAATTCIVIGFTQQHDFKSLILGICDSRRARQDSNRDEQLESLEHRIPSVSVGRLV
jgi:hypothetical protein